jgi:hypothetical protein
VTVICYDTEFLERNSGDSIGRTIDPISIGMVREDGEEYYAINRQAPWYKVAQHPWLRENVLPYIPGEILTKTGRYYQFDLDLDNEDVKNPDQIANEVKDFVLYPWHQDDRSLVTPELWAYYGSYDWVALCSLWGAMVNLPPGMPMWTHELMQYWEKFKKDPSLKPPKSDTEHHALADAKWDMQFYKNMANRETIQWNKVGKALRGEFPI